ncbi:hypothetical protein AAMO2058_000491200 [Amorphochlora amoebiformis]
MASGQSTARTSRVRSQEDVLYDRRIEEVGREIKSVKVKRAQKARSRQQVVVIFPGFFSEVCMTPSLAQLYQIDVETREREWATFKRFNAFYGFYRKVCALSQGRWDSIVRIIPLNPSFRTAWL